MDLLRSIHIFQQVAEQQSFSRAAENLNLVPSAVSRQISELEKWLGVRLINRTTRSLHLTEEGRIYLEKMGQIRHQVDELRSIQKDDKEVKGHLRLSAPMTIGQYALPPALAQFKQSFPHVTLSISLMNRKVDLVEEGFDLAVRVGHLSDSSMVARNIGSMSFKTVASSAYLTLHGCPTNPKELTKHNCLVNSAVSNPKRWSYQMNGKNILVKIDGELEVNDSISLKTFALADQGIAQLPSFYVEQAIASQKLVEILSDYESQPLPINLVYPSQKLLSPAVRALIEFLRNDLQKSSFTSDY